MRGLEGSAGKSLDCRDPSSKPSSAPQRHLGGWASHLPSPFSCMHSANSSAFPELLCKRDEMAVTAVAPERSQSQG